MADDQTGLRERKKQRTRETLVSRGLELFEANGFEQTTVNEVAAAADVSPSTFFRYFATKDDLLFAEHAERAEELIAALGNRSGGAVDALHDFFAESIPWTLDVSERRTRRRRVINRDSSLIGQEQLRYSEAIRPAIVAAFAHDLGAAETSAGANVLAALAISVIHEIRRAGDVAPADDAAGDQIAVFDAGMATLRAAYGALKMRE